MEYIKLIALNIDDLCSSIFFEDNYALTDIENAKKIKKDLESKGYTCIIVKLHLIYKYDMTVYKHRDKDRLQCLSLS